MVNLVAITLSTLVHSLMPEIKASWVSGPILKAKISKIKDANKDKE